MAQREAETSEKSNQSNTSTNSLASPPSNDCNSPIVLLPSPSFPSSSSNYCSKFQGSNLISHQQSQLQLQQSQSPSTTFESHVNSKKRKSQCDKCKNHLVRTLIKDHKKLCPYKNCTCGRCTFTIIRRRITSMNQRKRRQKEPSKDIFDNIHMSSRLKVLDKLTDDLDSMVKNPSNYRIPDELIGKFYDLLNNANFETKMRSSSSANKANSNSDSTVDPINKLTNGTSANCDEESSAFHPQKSSPTSLKANSLNGHYSLNGQVESEKSNLKLNLVNEPCKKKIRSLDHHSSELNGSALDFVTQPVRDYNSMSMSSSGTKGGKKDSTRIHEVPSIEVSPLEGNLRSTSVTSAHSPSPAASPISVGSEGRASPTDGPFMAVMPGGQGSNGKGGHGHGQVNLSGVAGGGGGGGKGRVNKVSPRHPPPAATSPMPYSREGHVSINDRSPLPQTLVPPATPSPFVSPHGPLYSYLYSTHPHRFSTYPLVPLATNAFRFSGQPSPLFTSGLNSVTAHNIGHSASLLQQWNRHLQQQLATHMNQQQATSNACRLTRMDP